MITKLNNLSDDLTGINCKKNPLKELYYPFNTKPKKYPSNLTHLTLGKKFNQPIDNLPKSLKYLIFDNRDGDYQPIDNRDCDFNQPIDNLPNSITNIILSKLFNQPIDNLPKSLKYLIFDNIYGDFNQPIDNLPNSITHLTFSRKFNCPVDNLPNSLINLQTGYYFNYPLDNLPNSLKHLTIGDNCDWGGSKYNYPLDNLPNSIEYLGFTNYSCFDKTLMNLPKSLTTLNLSGYYPISINNLPDTIENLNLNWEEDWMDSVGPPKCCKEKIYKLPKNIKNINIRNMSEIIQLDFNDLNKLHEEINNKH